MAMEELRDSTRARLEGRAHTPRALPHSLAFNLFPQVDVFQPDGYTREEDKMMFETRKILDLPELPVDATCVRVPVERCHSEAITVALERALRPEAARELLAVAPGVKVVDDPGRGAFPQPADLSGADPVAVGRIRASRVFDPGLTFWVVGDQLRKGAALNAVQIVENLCRTQRT
jgi:aspartate-semialdehyde dehydrogenase